MGGNNSRPAGGGTEQTAPAPMFTLDEGENIVASLRKLIPLVAAGDTTAQQKAASALANLAVQDEHQVTIVKEGGLLLLVPLMKCADVEVQRLAAHAIANLAVNGDNREVIVAEGGIPPLIALMQSTTVEVQRQSTKAIANLAVNATNKTRIVEEGALPPVIDLVRDSEEPVRYATRPPAIALCFRPFFGLCRAAVFPMCPLGSDAKVSLFATCAHDCNLCMRSWFRNSAFSNSGALFCYLSTVVRPLRHWQIWLSTMTTRLKSPKQGLWICWSTWPQCRNWSLDDRLHGR